MNLKVVHYGLGAIGKELAWLAASRPDYQIVGAVDVDPRLEGKDLAQVVELNNLLGVIIEKNLPANLSPSPDIVIHSTSSHLETVTDQIIECVRAGCDVVSTAEELANPYLQNPEMAQQIDKVAREEGLSVLGTGVNPGFAMDLLPLTLTGVCQEVNTITVQRIVDASVRRKPLQKKIGVGLSSDEFDRQIKKSGGHVGLVESVSLIASGLGWQIDEIAENLQPIKAKESIHTKSWSIEPDKVIGIHQVAQGLMDSRRVIELDLQMYLEAVEPRDRVHIEGIPDLDVTADGGIHGDIATPAVVVNSLPRVHQAPPGLHSILDLPSPFYHSAVPSYDVGETPEGSIG